MYSLSFSRSLIGAETVAEILKTAVGGSLRQAAARYGDAPLLTKIDTSGQSLRRWSYTELLRDAERCADMLGRLFRPGERILVCAPNRPEWVILQFGAAIAGWCW
jgi:acyl-CoA synthetase (AMP-forming)/AMP-acid ligase II